MTKNAIGIVELSSLAAGYATSDAMLKAANVNMLLTRSICSGKFMVMVGGDVAGVQAAVDAGAGLVAEKGLLVNRVVIPRPHKSLLNEMV
jgi:microcompartment protein CcmL/EutN